MKNNKTIRETNLETKANVYAKHEAAIPQPKPLTDKDLAAEESVRNFTPPTPDTDNRNINDITTRGFMYQKDYTLRAETDYINDLKPFKYDADTDTITTADVTMTASELYNEIRYFGVDISDLRLLRNKLINFSD